MPIIFISFRNTSHSTGPPLAGLLADKIGNFRIFMSLVTFLNGAASLLLLAVPNVNDSLHCLEANGTDFNATTVAQAKIECIPGMN